MRYYNKSIEETFKYLNVNKEIGLNTEDIELGKEKYSYNEFTIKEGKSIYDLLIHTPYILHQYK